jgi:hypothetical protein
LTECARLLWSNTYLFSTSAAAIERQKNLRQIESLLTDGVLQSIRSMLPVKNILREYLKEDSSDDEAAEAVAAVAAAPAAPAAAEAEGSKEVAEAATTEAAAAPATPPPSPEAATAAGEAAATTGPVFTGMETEFQSAEGDLPDLESEDGEDEEDTDDEEGNDIPEFQEENLDIQILDEPPVPLDNFEDLDAPAAAAAPPSKAEEEETLGMEDFEVLE